MATQVISNEFTDDEILFASKADANVWRLSLVVPDATPSVGGTVKQAAFPAAAASVSTQDKLIIQWIDANGNPILYEGVTYASYQTLKAQVDALQTLVNSLRQALIDAGIAI